MTEAGREAARVWSGQVGLGALLMLLSWGATGSLAWLIPVTLVVGLVSGWAWAVRRPGRGVDRALLRGVSSRVGLAWGCVVGLAWAWVADASTPGGLVRVGLALVMGAAGGGAVGGLTACGIDAGRADR